jgi:hypothetical protein
MRIAAAGFCLGLILVSNGCIPRRTATTAPPAAPATAAGAPPAAATVSAFTAVAVPRYRLVAAPALLDAPSRLVVVQLRMEATGDQRYTVSAGDVTIALPDGTHARIFDRARAGELLRRAILADADMAYRQRPDHVPGGIDAYSSAAFSEMVRNNLLGEGTVSSGQPVQGYVVIDTGQALTSLDGTSFEVIARRVGDYAPARYAYQYATAGAATTGTP